MNYKYSKGQIFGKRLKVPSHILARVYHSSLPLEDFIEYHLEDKIPISCIRPEDRKIVEKFGIDKCRDLDWELLNNTMISSPYNYDIDLNELLLSIDENTENINNALYELIKDKVKPVDYSSKMRKVYSDRILDESQSNNGTLVRSFNNGQVELNQLISNWELFKSKDLSYCLMNDEKNNNHITNDMVKDFMSNYGELATLITENSDVYAFISNLYQLNSDGKQEYIKQFTDYLLDKTIKKNGVGVPHLELTDIQYKEVFKYSSIEDYLKKFNSNSATSICNELKLLPKDYLFNISIPFSILKNKDVLNFLGAYGIKNIVDFDNECGHFFTKDNFKMLSSMSNMYLYGSYRSEFLPLDVYDSHFNYVRHCTKEEFYNAMREMIIYGPGDNFKAPDYRNLTGEFRDKNSDLFISEQAPDELKDLFYTKQVTSKIFLEHPEYIEFIKEKNYASSFKNSLVKIGNNRDYENFYTFLSNKMNFNDVMKFIIEYGDVLDTIFDKNVRNSEYQMTLSLEDDINNIPIKICEVLKKLITENGTIYPNRIPQKIREAYPKMFLDKEAPKELQEAFYNRKLTLNDFINNPDLINAFNNTNIIYGFSINEPWIILLYDDLENQKRANYMRLKVMSQYFKIQDKNLQDMYKNFITVIGSNIDENKIDCISEVLYRLSLSNSSEMYNFRTEIATQLLDVDNPLESLNKIENIFTRNNLPVVGKIYSCFDILHPDFQGFDFGESSTISPVLKNSSASAKKVIVFSDLIKSSFGSNNRSVNSYLKNIEYGCSLYENIKAGLVKFDLLGENEKRELVTFRNHLATLYNNTKIGKNDGFIYSENVLDDILQLSKNLSPDGTLDYNLANRVIRMFCGFAGIDTLDQAKSYIEQKIKTADSRNREASNSDMMLEQGDFIKGIGDVKYLGNILQNGSVSKEYLGSSAGSDLTPLDTDMSMILDKEGTISEKINKTVAKEYGPIWFVLKNDDRFITTRTNTETLPIKRDLSKIEAFYTGVIGQDHYGIRTGFASSEINYIVMTDYDPRVGLEVALNGIYIPVVNKEGKVLFTPKDYDEIRAKMSGLSYYDEQNYSFSNNLVTEETKYLSEQIEQSNREVSIKREKINNIIKKSLEELGLQLKTNIDGDLTEGFVELIDTGSTGRGTNKPGDGDFDFMMRLDKNLFSNPSELDKLKQTILKNLVVGKAPEAISSGDFRLKGVQIDNDTVVDIDITFINRTDKVSYSSDMALQDRLSTIQRINPEKYKYVVANILLAKQVLKKAGAYKPNRGDVPQGGLGGVGIENWILQNGGSFIDAAQSFVMAADSKNFEEFKSGYQIWDFGENHLAERKGRYSHDNFVDDNMSLQGYEKMVQAFKEYLKTLNLEQLQTDDFKVKL